MVISQAFETFDHKIINNLRMLPSFWTHWSCSCCPWKMEVPSIKMTYIFVLTRHGAMPEISISISIFCQRTPEKCNKNLLNIFDGILSKFLPLFTFLFYFLVTKFLSPIANNSFQDLLPQVSLSHILVLEALP